jgi:predicted phosphodiesterase
MTILHIYALSRDAYWLKTIASLQSKDLVTHPIECVAAALTCLEQVPAADPAALLLVDASDFSNIVETVKQLQQRGWVHVVVVAARVAWQEARRAFTEGAVFDYWAKTYVAEELRRDISDALAVLREGALAGQAGANAAAGRPASPGARALHILHISDLHLTDATDTDQLLPPLIADLEGPLAVRRLNYLIVSGDVSLHGDAAGLQAGRQFTERLADRFSLSAKRILLLPGNHDRDRGDALQADTVAGQLRFSAFNTHLYHPLLGQDYPADGAAQGILRSFPSDHLLVATLNSVCDTKQYNQGRSSIAAAAVVAVTARLAHTEHVHQGWLRMAVWHHPVLGPDKLQDTLFLRLLAQHGVHIVLHGHVHEAGQTSYEEQGIRFIGAGACGMPGRRQVPPVPFGYNLLTVEKEARTVTVYPRWRSSVDGDWQGEDRWRSGPGVIPSYTIPWSPVQNV